MCSKLLSATVFLLFVSLVVGGNVSSRQNSGQSQPLSVLGPDIHEKRFAVDLARVINTAEMTYRDQNNKSFAAWDTLAASPGFKKARDIFLRQDPKLGDINLASSSDLVAGWRLRLVVTPDNKSYVVVVTSTSDKNCGYAVMSDEEGLIREARAIGCAAP
jgi:hypothetical protein